ncbi:MAG: FkbM family methyltransferase [Candidatus Omnitrophica bacterium]|nr:FkbM family methyltransferase [Candidatus Omnitrophota bacterium]
MPKLDKVLFDLIPNGTIKDILRSAYYFFYYNKKRAGQNGFSIYYKKGYYEYVFPNGIKFKCYEKIIDDLQRSLPGYIAKNTIRRGGIIIDCGAYIGEFTLYAAKAVGENGKVIAFEPDPDAYEKLSANISLNNLKNVILIKKGVWSKTDKMKFVGGTQSGNLFADKLNDNTISYEVIVTSLDDELGDLGIIKVDFIKMDIEGAEIEALKGARKILAENNTHLAIASYHSINGQKTYMEIEKILKSFGYKSETGYPSHLTTYGYKS